MAVLWPRCQLSCTSKDAQPQQGVLTWERGGDYRSMLRCSISSRAQPPA